MDSWRCCGISLKILILLVLQNLNLSVTVCDTADGIFTNFASGEDLGTINRNHEPYSSTNHVESSQTTTCNNLRNIHDNRLISSRSVYSFDIPENVMPGTKVGLVTASAPNQGVDDKVYAIQEDDGNGLFVINPVTGNFTLTRSLDFESAKYYILTVKVLSTDEQFNLIRAYFNVLDINDNPPVFHPDSYSINIMENVPIGTSILTLNITDADEGPNAALTFKIISGDLNGQFAVDRNAVVTVEKKLNREHQSVYALIVQAVDQAQCDSTRFTSSAWITVTLNDVNDNTPEFRTVNTIYIPEDTSIGSVIMTVSAVDLDSGLNGQIEYSLQELTRNKFSINTTSGELSIIGDLDRELVERIMIDVIASDKGEPPLSSSISITIIITDVNDNSPSFMENIYTVTVDENIPRGSDLLIVSATDSDEGKNGQVRYVISSKDFCIDSVTGLISVSGKLDREKTPWYSFVVLALDDGKSPKSGTATVNVILRDFNDFAPIIQPMQVTFHLMENTSTVPQIVHQVLGRDDDLGSNSKLTYQINLGNEDGKFSISANGSLSLVQSLDREIRAEYMLVVTATDAGDPPLTGSGTIRIIVDDLNDNTPLFDQRQCSVTVSEAAPIGFKVLTVHAVDPDAGGNGQVSYSMDFGESPFSIDPISGEIVTTSTLDREIQTSYTLIVLATDKNHMEPLSSSTLVLVIVEDVNDEPPEFLNDPYVANVPAILNEGSFVYAVTTKDRDTGINADLSFSLYGPNANKFAIDPVRGVIFAKQILKGLMDITVIVNVIDGGDNPKMDSTTLTVRFQSTNDFPQFFVDNKMHVYPEDQAVNTVISKVSAFDNVKGKIRPILFYLAAGNFGDVFQMDQLTGELKIKNTLDFEIVKYYQLWIEARNSGSPPFSSYARIDINITDVNDNFPEFKQSIYRCEVYENVPACDVCNVSAADMDSGLNGFIEYSIVAGNVNDAFKINSSSGVIRTVQMLDRERMALYTLIVKAKDQGSNTKTGTATVIISVLDKNDNAPRFSQIFLAHVLENAPVGFTIVRITTTDDDIGMNAISTYSIPGKTASLPFGVNQSTGDLIVTRLLDRETTDWYIVRVHANDSAWDVNTDVTIFVIDTNDNVPQFTEPFYSLTIPEPKEKEMFVLQVSATDPDLESNGNIFYLLQPPHEFFRVNATTGEIFTKQLIPFKILDNPSADWNKINFTLTASDLGEPPNLSETTVTITIIARNDHPPIFLPHRQLTPVPVNLEFGTKVIKLTAVDEDSYSNGELEYYITGNNDSFLFGIEQDSGWIFIANSLASSLNKVFTVSITAHDKGTPSLSSSTIVNFIVTEENRFAPQFFSQQLSYFIPEDWSAGSVIDNLTASDNDQGVNGQIMYSIVAGNDGAYFSIENTTGLLTLLRSLDFEMDSVYILQINAEDGGWMSKTGSVNVIIQVKDANDNPPVFFSQVFFATVAENSPCGTTVFKVNATDNDSGIHAEINYIIEGGHPEFFIDPQFGIITVQEILNFELHQFYEVTVRAFNTHDSSKFSLAKVYVNVTGVNEYIPQFAKTLYNFSVSENALNGTIVGCVTATDCDLGFDGIVNYLLIGKSKDRGFQIDMNTGEVVVSGNMKQNRGSHVLLQVLAKNIGSISGFDVDEALINITILEDSNALIFKSAIYQTHVREDSLVGTSVISLMADNSGTIPEWKQFEIQIKDGNKNNSFSVNSQTGEVFIASSLDRETTPFYNLTITAFGRGTSPATGNAQLMIIVDDVNDNGPILVNTEGYIMENQPPGTQLIYLNATDLDSLPNQGPFRYQLADNSNASSFVTLSPAGVLSTQKMIEREIINRSECQQNLCQNGLTCLNLPRAFLCKCPPSYTGNLCQTIVNYCAMSHGHLNHGSCVNLPTEYNCSCPFRTSGNECDGSSLGFEELSYMELPSLDPTNNIIYVELATIRENSLLLYNYDNKEGADGEFLALEIINGKIEFSYNLGSGIVQLVTDQYVADGEFHKIFATRTGKVGSLTVDNCTNDQPAQFCFVSTPGIGTERTLDLEKNRMVFGGIKLIEPILLRPDQAKSHDFIGCIKEFRLNNIPVKFAEVLSSNNILTSCPRLGRMCQAKTCLNGGICLDRWSYYLCQCPEGFTGPHCEKDTAINFNGQFHLDYFIKESYKRDQLLNNHIKRKQNQKEDKDSVSIEIQFRTDSSEGILLHIQGSINYTTVKIMEGRINYISDASSVGYIKHRLNISISDSKWHTFKMESNDSVTTLMLDKKHIKSITHPTQRVGGIEISTLSLGQAPLLQFGNPNEQGFKGCIKIFKFNNHVMPFTGSNDLVEVRPRDSSVQIECRGPNVCLNNPCPTGMKGIDLWLAYECLLVSCFSDPCKHDSTCLPSSDGTYHCICKQDFTEFCTPTIIDHAACQKGNIQLPQWSIAVIILATLAVIPLIALFIKCLYITLKSKRTKIIASVQAVTEKMSDGHNDDVDNDLDNAGKQPDILKAENSYHIIDETYITATSMEQNKKSNGQGYDLEVNDIDNATSLTSSDFDVIKYHRQIQANNDHYNKAILHGSMQNKSQPFVAFVNQRNIQCLASQQSAVGHNPGPRNGFTNQQLTQMCSSEWFPSSVLFTERKHLINDLYLTDYETDHFQHGHFDSKKSSKGGIDNLAFCGDDQIESLPAASILMSSSRPSRRMIQIVERLPLGLSVEEIKRLNAPTIHKVVENTNQIISLSQIPQRPSAQKNHPGILPSTDTSSDSDSHSSFTCSEYNYERELPACSRSSVHKYAQQDSKRNIVEDEKMLNEREIGLEGHEKWYASDTCLIGTEIVTEEDSDNNMQPCDDSPVNKTHNWGDILNWGPRFEIYVEIFKDLAELPSEPGSENQFSTAGGSEHEEFL
ncbi:hypothetical protein chiPu_0013682 [Chiloscyllium punctatum]|uniref:Protocadherin Fat 4 n=1 Tax=Chiloscyllium punctatum TaxID=137246 RepID=A0A401SXR6_CHIPU|nr:hypothetical protein [Chiloscyllium punctatum]